MADINLNKIIEKFTKTRDHSLDFDPSDISSNKYMSILSYLSVLFLIPLFAAKGSAYSRFHVNQGILLCIVETVWHILIYIFSSIPLLGWLIGIIGNIGNLVLLAITILFIYYTINGKAKELPFIGSIRIIR